MKFFLKNLLLCLSTLGAYQGFGAKVVIADALCAAHSQTHDTARQNPMMKELISGNIQPDRYLQYLANLDILFEELEKKLSTRSDIYVPEGMKRSHQLKSHMNQVARLTGKDLAYPTPDARALAKRIRLEMEKPALTSMSYLLYGAATHGGLMIGKQVKKWLVENYGFMPESALPFYKFNEPGPKLFNIFKGDLPEYFTDCEKNLEKREAKYQKYFRVTLSLNSELLKIFSSAYHSVQDPDFAHKSKSDRSRLSSKYIDESIQVSSAEAIAVGATLVGLALTYWLTW